MDFGYSDEQTMMYESVLGILRQEAGPPVCRKTYESGARVAKGLAGTLADQGILGAGAAELYGGSQLTLLDFALVFEAAGQTLLPFPLVENYVATMLVDQYGEELQKQRWLSSIARGETIPTLAWGDINDGFDKEGVQAVRRDGAMRLYGRRKFVPFVEAASVVVMPVYAVDDNTVMLVFCDPAKEGVSIEPLNSLDGSYPLGAISLNGYRVQEEELVARGRQAWVSAQTVGLVALSQEALGVAEEAFRTTVEYVKVREQFGGPVGRFQAVKHTAADDYLLLESARVANRYAAWLVSQKSPEGWLYAAMAKAYSSDMARRVTGDAIQLHGGIGFTWESDMHLYFKRAWRLASELGRPTDLREGMARRVIDGREEEGDGYGFTI